MMIFILHNKNREVWLSSCSLFTLMFNSHSPFPTTLLTLLPSSILFLSSFLFHLFPSLLIRLCMEFYISTASCLAVMDIFSYAFCTYPLTNSLFQSFLVFTGSFFSLLACGILLCVVYRVLLGTYSTNFSLRI